MRTGTENKITLRLIRHGKTAANEERRYIGRTDEPLSENGIAELEKLYPRKLEADMVFASPMKRCIQTAKIIYGTDAPVIINEWRETDFGSFEMKNHEELDGDPAYQAWIDSGGKFDFPGGEGQKSFTERVVKGFDIFLEKCLAADIKNAAAVVHGGTIMALLSSFTGADDYSFLLKNGSGYETVFRIENGKAVLESVK